KTPATEDCSTQVAARQSRFSPTMNDVFRPFVIPNQAVPPRFCHLSPLSAFGMVVAFAHPIVERYPRQYRRRATGKTDGCPRHCHPVTLRKVSKQGIESRAT